MIILQDKVTVIFVKGDDKDCVVDRVIDAVSKGEYSHVAIKILGGVVEALGEKDADDKYPGVWVHNAGKYDNDPDATMVDVDLPNIARAEAEAESLIGTLYGYVDCVNGGVYDMTGKQLPADGVITADCSETVTRILKAGGLNIFPTICPDCITPNDLYRALIKN